MRNALWLLLCAGMLACSAADDPQPGAPATADTLVDVVADAWMDAEEPVDVTPDVPEPPDTPDVPPPPPDVPDTGPEDLGCQPDCDGKECGLDGCGGICGVCDAAKLCIDGVCGCSPDCDGKTCGDDLCGGSCGPDCPEGELCIGGSCGALTCQAALADCAGSFDLPVPPATICSFVGKGSACETLILAAYAEDGCYSSCSVFPVPGMDKACNGTECSGIISLAKSFLSLDICLGCKDPEPPPEE